MGAGVARALGGHQQHELGYGAAGLLGLELPFGSLLGAELRLGSTWLSEANAPVDGTLAPQGDATAYDGTLALRVYPLAGAVADGGLLKRGGVWLAAGGGVVTTAELWRPTARAELGVDFRVHDQIAAGPMLGFAHVFQPDDELRPADANLVFAGVHLVFEPWRKPPAPKPYVPPPAPPKPPEPVCPGAPGCPEPDRDGDGIPDTRDQCPEQPEDKDGYQDEDGCPDEDNDQDGTPDLQDQCPGEPETPNGYADDDGCPDEAQVRVVGDRIVLDDRVHFHTNRATLRAQSYPLLERLAKLLEKRPEYVHVEVQGHADERGSIEANQQLSEQRAERVRQFLIEKGIAPERLSAVGFGETKPLFKDAPNTPGIWFLNRRVEFVITRARGANVAPPGQLAPPPESGSSNLPPAGASPDPGSAAPAEVSPTPRGE